MTAILPEDWLFHRAREGRVSPNESRVLQDALDIADESAVSLIESETLEFNYGDGPWHNLDSAADAGLTPETNARIRASLDQSARYLIARGLAESPVDKPHLVRFREWPFSDEASK